MVRKPTPPIPPKVSNGALVFFFCKNDLKVLEKAPTNSYAKFIHEKNALKHKNINMKMDIRKIKPVSPRT